MKPVYLLGIPIVLVLFFESCFSSKPQSYFNGMIDTTAAESFHIPDPVIQKNDQLGIMIYSDNPEATAIYNQAGRSLMATGSQGTQSGTTTGTPTQTGPQYIVDNEGNIRLHEMGVIHAEGLTKQELSDLITQKLKDLGVLQNPYCVIRFTNFKVTVLGEVKNPGVFTLPVEKATVLEALGMAGDVGDFGRKDGIMLIRENQGRRTYAMLNLLDTATLSSPNYFLQQNDVILVQADKRKQTAADREMLTYVTIGATIISSFAVIISLLK